MRRILLFIPLTLFALMLLGLRDHEAQAQEHHRNFAGSVQLDYLEIPSQDVGRDVALDGATVELSLKLAIDFDDQISSNIKVCVACHGFEIGMAYFDVHKSDLINFRVGRFTPQFGSFPLRHDPANHRTSDKPLPYDMGRMLRTAEWNMSVLPTPWVDNGIELSGTKFAGDSARFDYAVYAVGGPKGSNGSADINFDLSRSRNRYYVDNNSRPSLGAKLGAAFDLSENLSLAFGASGMGGHYDPQNKLSYIILGADLQLRFKRIYWRSEYLVRRTKMSLGEDPAAHFKYGPGISGNFDPYFIKDGFYTELEVPLSPKLDLIGRWDGMRRIGNVVATSPLRSRSAILRYTAAIAYKLSMGLRIKSSLEYYDFSDFKDELALHLALAGPF